MISVKFVQEDGTETVVEVEAGTSLMEAAVYNGVPGIDGDCGGACACATCHVFIDPQWAGTIAPIGSTEDAMLAIADGRSERSRLGCQVKLTDAQDGMVVGLPRAQH